jgi:hypothetical protein
MHLYHSNQRHDLADTGMIVHAYVAITKRSFRHLTSDPKALMAAGFSEHYNDRKNASRATFHSMLEIAYVSPCLR